MIKESFKGLEKAALEELVRKCKIVGESESYDMMKDRVFSSVIDIEKNYGTPDYEISEFKSRMMKRFESKEIVPSTTILTNAGRYLDKPLTACSVPPISLKEELSKVKQVVDQYHQKGMGTGFNFDECDNPVEVFDFLNQVGIDGQNSGKEDRPVGNMALISSDHPQIENMLKIKDGDNKDKKWNFNLSINIKDDFMTAYREGNKYMLRDGSEVEPEGLLDIISKAAWSCGDPGVAYMDRFDSSNPVPHLGKYKSLAPCGEVAMTDGETCQFTYINVGSFVEGNKINYDSLKSTVHDVVRFLDDALDVSLKNYDNESSEWIMNQKRKIGVGICGFADMLIKCGVPYDSNEAEIIAEDIMSFITYQSKKASVGLAKDRGPFGAFKDNGTRIGKGFIRERYGSHATNVVSKQDWVELSEDISQYGMRNVSTTALPPTGRSSLVISASPSIEPYFSIRLNNEMTDDLCKKLDECGYDGQEMIKSYDVENGYMLLDKAKLPEEIRDIYKTCLEISPEQHLKIVSRLQKFTDESISKTINLDASVTPHEIKDLYIMSYDLGLKGMTVYRNNSRLFQPEKVGNQELVI